MFVFLIGAVVGAFLYHEYIWTVRENKPLDPADFDD